MAIYVRCRACGQEHEFPVIIAQTTFESLARSARSAWTRSWVRCPKEGSTATVSSQDLFWKD